MEERKCLTYNETRNRMLMMAEKQNRYSIDDCLHIINAILSVYMVKGVEYDFPDCINSFKNFIATGTLAF